MKFEKMPLADERPEDSSAMREAIRRLRREGFHPRRPPNNPYQLKVAPTLSYYPSKGTIFRDRDPAALPARGLDALVQLLEAEADDSPLRLSDFA